MEVDGCIGVFGLFEDIIVRFGVGVIYVVLGFICGMVRFWVFKSCFVGGVWSFLELVLGCVGFFFIFFDVE